MIDIFNEVEKVYNLYQQGIITGEEFDKQKDALFAQQIKDVSDTPMVRIGPAYKSFWKNTFRWRTRATRAEYFWPLFINTIIGFLLNFWAGFTQSSLFMIAYILFCILILLPNLSVYVRRFHDIGHTAKFALLPIFFALSLALIAISFQGIDYAIRPAELPKFLLMLRSFIFVAGGFILMSFGFFWWAFLIFPSQMKTNKWGDPR